MSQGNVERVIGRLLTDEGFRRRFGRDPQGELAEFVETGFELNPCELRALATLDPAVLSRLAEAIDPRLQKIDPSGESVCDA